MGTVIDFIKPFAWTICVITSLVISSKVNALVSVEEAGAVLDSYAVSPKHGEQLFPEADFINNSGIASFLAFKQDLVFYRVVAVPEKVVSYGNNYITHIFLSELNHNPITEEVFSLWVDKNLRKDRNFKISIDSPDYKWAIIVSDEPINQIFVTEVEQNQGYVK